MNLGKIENDVWVSNDRTLIENYYTLLYFKKFITDKEYYMEDSNNLSKYYIHVMKGMLNRCIRQDQKDWKFVYICFGFTSGTSSIHTIVRYIEQMERNLNYYKIADDRFEYISEKQEMYINKLSKRNFNRSMENALIRILDEIYKRNLEEYTKMSLDEFIYSEFATKVNFNKINYNLVFGGIGNVEEGMYIKDRLHNVTPGTRRSFYKRLLKVAKTNEELDEIRSNIIKEGISIIVPNSVDHVIINRYKNLNDENINNYFEKYNSFEEAWENRSDFIDKEDESKLKFFGSILLKVDNKQQLNLVKNEMNYYEIKRQRNDKYNKLLYHINNSQSLDSAIEVKNIMYKEGLLVGLKVYHTIIDKFKDVEGIDKVIDEMNLLLEDEICYKNLLDDIDQAESFEECMNLKRAALENGVVINLMEN